MWQGHLNVAIVSIALKFKAYCMTEDNLSSYERVALERKILPGDESRNYINMHRVARPF